MGLVYNGDSKQVNKIRERNGENRHMIMGSYKIKQEEKSFWGTQGPRHPCYKTVNPPGIREDPGYLRVRFRTHLRRGDFYNQGRNYRTAVLNVIDGSLGSCVEIVDSIVFIIDGIGLRRSFLSVNYQYSRGIRSEHIVGQQVGLVVSCLTADEYTTPGVLGCVQ
ncbi:hypothetical protein AVEN_114636-1 [Araneus ventricosus]|uniref:Uncharacterized protein n=1 Tax=Araneus ventricosus TaxID=182803 RepID=A0A4Y2QAU6_ARAVE|nr:hypothetical protein AVEN_114636-1 [Araneus ventricosus]